MKPHKHHIGNSIVEYSKPSKTHIISIKPGLMDLNGKRNAETEFLESDTETAIWRYNKLISIARQRVKDGNA